MASTASPTGGLSYPNLVQSLAATFPGLLDHISPDDGAGASAPPMSVDDAIATSEAASYVHAHNDACPFCKMKLAASSRPVAVLECGHAYHAHCGRSLLQRGDGKECSMTACHRDAADVLKSRMREAVLNAAQQGKFDLTALRDPVHGPMVQMQIIELMREAGMPLENTAIDEVSNAAARSADEQTRTEQAYRERWMQSPVGKDGFSQRQKRALLSSYMNVIKVTRHSPTITMQELYKLEEEKRREEAADDQEGISNLAFLTSDTPAPYKVTAPDEKMRMRLSLEKMFDAGIRLSDLYFRMGVTTWTTLKAMGLTKAMLSDRDGAMPLVPLMDLYKIRFETVRTDLGILATDLAAAHINADDMKRAGVHFPLLCMKMGMTKEMMPEFGFSPNEWNKQLRMDKKFLFSRNINFGASDFAYFRWSPPELQQAFDLNDVEMRIILDIPDLTPMQTHASASAPDQHAPSAPALDPYATPLAGVPVQTLRGPVSTIPVI